MLHEYSFYIIYSSVKNWVNKLSLPKLFKIMIFHGISIKNYKLTDAQLLYFMYFAIC